MTRQRLLISTILSAALFCSGVVLAQEPSVDINSNRHPYLAKAQRLVNEANKCVVDAQKDNRYDMHGHATKARQLMIQVNEELKAAAEDANAADAAKKK
ncbi:MAG TPA: hypothetical protein VEG68_06565 [Terriglobales bacterium]|nr:hypothetical protein [Terriglobales bacterium]